MEMSFLTGLAGKAEKEHIPMSGQFELTPVCNLKCHMCYVHKPEEDSSNAGKLLPASFWIETAKQMKESGTLVLSLTGGETLLYPEIDSLMAELTQMGFLISFNTNGTLIDEKRVQWFKKYVPTKINISLYGATNGTYEKLCGIKNGFDRVKNAIELLLAAGFNVYLNAVLVPENIGELQEMHRFAAEHGLVLHTTAYIFPTRSMCEGKGTGHSDYRLSAFDAANAVCYNKIVMEGLQSFRKNAAANAYMLEQMEKQTEWKPDFHECRAGKCLFAVNREGFLQPCIMFDSIQVSLREHTFIEAWEEMSEKMRALPVPEKCKSCRKQAVCPVCKAAVYQETGTHDRAPEYLCEYCRELAYILKREGSGIEISVPDCGDFHYCGCTD